MMRMTMKRSLTRTPTWSVSRARVMPASPLQGIREHWLVGSALTPASCPQSSCGVALDPGEPACCVQSLRGWGG